MVSNYHIWALQLEDTTRTKCKSLVCWPWPSRASSMCVFNGLYLIRSNVLSMTPPRSLNVLFCAQPVFYIHIYTVYTSAYVRVSVWVHCMCECVHSWLATQTLHWSDGSLFPGLTCRHSNKERQLQTGPQSHGNGAGQTAISRVCMKVNKLPVMLSLWSISVPFNQHQAERGEPHCN